MRRLALLLAPVLAACAPQVPEAQEGRRPTIVSLNPCSDAVLAEVADREQVLAISHFSHDPASSSMELAKARTFPAISGSAEEVLALAPDVVVADQFVPVSTRNALADLGIALVQLPIARSVAQSREQVVQLAELAGHPERGRALNAKIDASLARAAPASGASKPVTAIVWQSGGIVPGPDTLVADLLRRTGFVQSSAERGMRQADYLPLEAMLADPPRLILAAGNRRAQENRLLGHPALSALEETRREPFDSTLLWCGGPTIIRAAERLAALRRSFAP